MSKGCIWFGLPSHLLIVQDIEQFSSILICKIICYPNSDSSIITQGLDADMADKRSSPIEGARDVAVIEAILKSSSEDGAWITVDPILIV